MYVWENLYFTILFNILSVDITIQFSVFYNTLSVLYFYRDAMECFNIVIHFKSNH